MNHNVDAKLSKLARSYFGKHGLDIANADVRVHYGLCMVTGKIRRLPKVSLESVEERAKFVAGIIVKISGIKDVVLQCNYEEDYFK